MKTRNIFYLVFCGLAMVVVQGCQKQTVPALGQTATLNIINALPTSLPLIPVQGTVGPIYTDKVPSLPEYGKYQNFKGAATVSYGSTFLINPQGGTLQLYLVQKNADTMVVNGQLSKYIFNHQLNLTSHHIYSLFITGPDTTAGDYLLVQDQLPVHQDSTCGVRFVNISANSNPVSVNIQGLANGSEVQSLAYKGLSSFKSYAATSNIGSYVFEFRDVSTGVLLASYTLRGVNNDTNTNGAANSVRFHNMTLCLIGQPGGTGANAQKVILVNNY